MGRIDITGDRKSSSTWPFQTGSPHLSRFMKKGQNTQAQTYTRPKSSLHFTLERSIWMDNKSVFTQEGRMDAVFPLTQFNILVISEDEDDVRANVTTVTLKSRLLIGQEDRSMSHGQHAQQHQEPDHQPSSRHGPAL